MAGIEETAGTLYPVPEPELTPKELIGRARAMRERLIEEAPLGEARGGYSEELHEEFTRAGFYRALQPRRYGGYEFGLDTAGNARIRRIHNGSGGTLSQTADVGDLKGKVRIEAACEQSGKAVRLAMWVNGSRVVTADDPNGIGNGSVGVFARTPKDDRSVLKMAYDDFELRGDLPQP